MKFVQDVQQARIQYVDNIFIELRQTQGQMSHLRDLQRLRNTKNNFQIKRDNKQPHIELKLDQLRSSRGTHHNQEISIKPELIVPKVLEIDQQQDADAYSKYLHSKNIITMRESKDRQSQMRTSEKLMKQHKRGGSFGVGSTFYDLRSKEIPQSGMSVYNFSIKLSDSNQLTRIPPSNISARKSNPPSFTIRRDKTPELFMDTSDNSPTLRHLQGSKIKRVVGGDIRIHHQLNFNSKHKEDENYMMGKSAFDIICPVGKGGFGKVWKVRCKKTNEIFAMKEMQKAKIINKKSINSVMNERILLADLDHPFLVNIKSSFQDRENLYLVMDYLNGGDLRYHIGSKGKFSQAETKFFIANIIVGLEYLHEHKIIHRDLKPENFVLDSEGYLRITDLGVSKIVRDDNHQDTSGTPGYMAPQVICHKNHSFTADYFALGVMGYEFMLGRRPYNGKNRKQIREHILSKQVEIKIDELPYKWSPKAADFISQLLQRNPEKRLGRNGIDEIKNHPWLADIDWKAIKEKSMRSPFIPLSIEQNYDDYKEQISEDTVDENVEQTKMMLRDPQVQGLFQGYEFNDQKTERKKSLRSTNATDSEHLSLRGSWK